MKSKIYLNRELVTPITFSGGERHLTMSSNCGRNHVYAELRDSDGIMDLLLLADAIKRASGWIQILTIPYLPYARQDRVCNFYEPHSLAVMAGLINSIGAKEVVIIDAHSSVTEALIGNYVDIDLVKIHFHLGKKLFDDYDVLIAPDAGAEKKVFKLAQHVGARLEVARKVRDTKTGDIVKTVFDSNNLNQERVLIVDDICDGGRTFIELAKLARKYYPHMKCLDLYTSHGIYSKGVEVLTPYFDNIYTLKFNPETLLELDIKL